MNTYPERMAALETELSEVRALRAATTDPHTLATLRAREVSAQRSLRWYRSRLTPPETVQARYIGRGRVQAGARTRPENSAEV